MFSLFGFFGKDDKPVMKEGKDIDLTGLENYIKKKGNKDVDLRKQFTTALDIGKFKLALLIEESLNQQMKRSPIDYQQLRKDLFIYFKINEFFERSDRYSSMHIPIESELTNRKSLDGLIKASEKKKRDLGHHSKLEVMALFKEFKKLYDRFEPPIELPENVRTGSGIYGRCSTLHPEINNLYKQVSFKCELQEKAAASLPEL